MSDQVNVLTEAEAAELLKVSVRTLRNMRWHGKRGPAFSKVGRFVRYSRDDVAAYVEAQKRTSTTEQPAT